MTTSFINAQRMLMYLDLALLERSPIALAADGTGVISETNDIIYWDAVGNATEIFNPSVNATKPYMVSSRDYAYFVDGVSADLLKWNIQRGLSKWGISSPTNALTLGTPGAGNITLVTGRVYYYVYYNSVTGNYSDLSQPSIITGPLTNQDQPLTGFQTSTDPQVTDIILLATADGGDPTILYFVADLPPTTTSYTDDLPETSSDPALLTNPVYLYTDTSGVDHGVAENQPPPNGSYPINHRDRIYMAFGSQIVFSKSLDEVTTSSNVIAGRYEEDWPPGNAIEVATVPEIIHGFLSDGITLYIGTELHIRQLSGYNAATFSQPEVVFNDTGLCCQDVWQVVYLEGTPVGTMWMTPDFRVLGSDFTTFSNVGTPIQSTLNSIYGPTATNSFAMSTRLGPYNFYALFIPTGEGQVNPNTICVFDMHLRKWYIWNCADTFSAGVYYVSIAGIPRWLMCDGNGITRLFDDDLFLDRQGDTNSVGITSTIQTTWLDLSDASVRKSLNEVEVETFDSNMLVTIDGATNESTFNTPNNLVTSAGLVTNLFGDFKVYLTGTTSYDRYYRFTFVSTSSPSSTVNDVVMGAMHVEIMPLQKF